MITSENLAKKIRMESIKMVARAKASHIGGALSIADLLAVLYTDILKVDPEHPEWEERDRLILSKGHSCVGLYSTLALKGFFPIEELLSYGLDGSSLMAHVSHKVAGVDFSTGSLGHGLLWALTGYTISINHYARLRVYLFCFHTLIKLRMAGRCLISQ